MVAGGHHLDDWRATAPKIPGVAWIRGALFGSGNPFDTIPRLLELYRAGQLKLDELVTTRYRLDEVNQGYQDMLDGRNIRGLMIHDS
jgi:alcohol dehydrogenase (nicotinoprotein)